MLIIEPCAGLSNRILALATAYQLASENHQRIIVLWDIDNTVGTDIRNLFALPEDIKIIKTTKQSKAEAPLLWCKSKLVRWYFRRKSSAFFDCDDIEKHIHGETILDYKQFLVGKNCIYIKAFCELTPIRNKNIFSIFKASKEVLNRGRDVFERIGSKTCGFHIRRTDHREAIKNSPVSLFIKEAEDLLRASEENEIFLATDDIELEKYMKKKFGTRVFSFEQKVFSRANSQGMQDGLVDLLALSKCCIIYGSYGSTFSRMASYIGNNELIILKRD